MTAKLSLGFLGTRFNLSLDTPMDITQDDLDCLIGALETWTVRRMSLRPEDPKPVVKQPCGCGEKEF